MFFYWSRRSVVILAIIAGAFLIIETASVILFALMVLPEFRSATQPLNIAWGSAMLIFIVAYVIWLQKYYYFFKLRRLLKRRVGEGRHIEFVSKKTRYFIRGRAFSHVITKTLEDGAIVVLNITDDYAWVDARPPSMVPTTALGQRNMFKSLTKALNTTVSS